MTNTVKMQDSCDNIVSPYIVRVMTNSKMLDVLSELANSIQESIDKYMWPVISRSYMPK